MNTTEIALTVSIFSAVIAVLSLIITANKAKYEIPKFKLEIEKLTREISKVQTEVKEIQSKTEKVIYDGRNRDISTDFTGMPFYEWSNLKNDFLKIMGEGSHNFKGNIIEIVRTNKEGRYSMSLVRYNMPQIVKKIPSDTSIIGNRKIRFSCEAKSIGGEHQLTFLLKPDNEHVTAHIELPVITNEWSPLDGVLTFRPDVGCFLRIDDQKLTNNPSTIQIRNIVLTQLP